MNTNIIIKSLIIFLLKKYIILLDIIKYGYLHL